MARHGGVFQSNPRLWLNVEKKTLEKAAQKYSDKKREPKLGDLSYFRYQIRHDDKDERLARSRSWEYKLSKYLFALPGFITLAIIFGVYEKKTRQNEQSHWTIRFLVERFKRIKKFLLE